MAADGLKKMQKILNSLMKDDNSYAFREPVDWKGLNLYDYPEIIKNPMDLGTIQKKLEGGSYGSAAECAADVRLVWENCKLYNRDNKVFFDLATKLSRKFEERYSKVAEFEALTAKGNTAAKEPAGPPQPTLADKTRFGYSIYSIGREELGKLMMQLDQRCPDAIERTEGNEISVNLDMIDAPTFWVLSKFVSSLNPQIDEKYKNLISEETRGRRGKRKSAQKNTSQSKRNKQDQS